MVGWKVIHKGMGWLTVEYNIYIEAWHVRRHQPGVEITERAGKKTREVEDEMPPRRSRSTITLTITKAV